MPAPLISPAEKSYIEQGIEQDCRADGRNRLEYRHLVLESGLLSQASGSARCRLGDSDVLVGVKVEIGEIDPEKPNVGRIICNVNVHQVPHSNLKVVVLMILTTTLL
ncbi:unnamed protein product [Cunninghamella echinulata]